MIERVIGMEQSKILALATKCLEAWTSQDVDAVVSCYSEDLIYLDPNTRGEVRGRDAMRRYLRKLFSNWQMTWALREMFLFDKEEGGAFLWHATFKKPGGEKMVEADGMDLVIMEGDLIKRNEVYFDRAVLAPLIA